MGNVNARAGYGWMWALSMLLPALALGFFVWHIISKAPQQNIAAMENNRVVTMTVTGGDVRGGPQTESPKAVELPPEPVASSQPLIPPPGGGLKPTSEALTEMTSLGPLPKIGADGTKAWQYYARTFTVPGDTPVIAVVVTGLGLNKQLSDLALRLPADISLSFSPYAADAPVWAGSARALGHEVLVDIPFEPQDYPAVDPGPYGLLTGLGVQANENNLRWVLTRFSGYVGGVAAEPERFMADNTAAHPILQFLAGRGLMLDMGAPGLPAQASQMLERAGLPFVSTEIRLEADMTRDTITTQLLSAERIARAHGHALIIAEAAPLTLKELEGWSELIGQKGIILVPVSALARLKFS